MSKKKTEKKVAKTPSCTLADLQKAGAQQLRLGDQTVGLCLPRSFATGSYGFGYSGPVVIQLADGKFAECQASVNITVKHSKPAEAAEPVADAA